MNLELLTKAESAAAAWLRAAEAWDRVAAAYEAASKRR